MTAIDFSAKLIDPTAIREVGHRAVVVYVSPARPGSEWMRAKPATEGYVRKLVAAGLRIASVWQYGKPDNPDAPSDWTTGFDGGVRMAREAAETHAAIGGPDTAPIFFAVDENLTLDNWNGLAVEFFRGVNSVLGVERTGVYGHSRVCAWAAEDGVIGSNGRGQFWAWQTRAWSSGQRAPEAVLFQRVIDTPTEPGPLIDGARVDVNDILSPRFGQWHPEESPMVTKPDYTEHAAFGPSSSQRWGARVTNFLLHTQEGNGSAESLAAYLNNPNNGVSYHYTLRDGQLVAVVDTDRAAWSVLDANPHTINLCFAGSRAAWSRQQWLEREHDLRVAAWVAVADARKYGFSTEVLAPDYPGRRDGIADHNYVTRVLGMGTHTDCGPNFPWDVFAGFVAEYASGGFEAVSESSVSPNAIDTYAAQNDWLGARLSADEMVLPDKVGRLASYTDGTVYWHPDTGAFAVPPELFGSYARLKYEAGVLGYPVTDHTVLDGGGMVQGFQGGALYRKDEASPARAVRGAIRDRWNRSGYESGPLGWPITEEYPADRDGAVQQEFEHGRIIWAPSNNTIALLDKQGRDLILEDS